MRQIDWAAITPKEGVRLQNDLRDQVVLRDDFGEINTVAGVDVSCRRGWEKCRCGIVVLSFPELEMVETRVHETTLTFPYVPGLLAFREAPPFLETYDLLQTKPDLIIFDSQGYAHPRRLGLACHAGLLIDVPSIGCAKSRLIGEYEEPGRKAGEHASIYAPDGERIGDVVRTRTGVKPVFVSPGHRVSFDSATRIVLECCAGYRLPQPTRLAHMLVSTDTCHFKTSTAVARNTLAE